MKRNQGSRLDSAILAVRTVKSSVHFVMRLWVAQDSMAEKTRHF